MTFRRYAPTAAAVVLMSVAVGVFQHVWQWSNALTNLAAMTVIALSLLVFWLTGVPGGQR